MHFCEHDLVCKTVLLTEIYIGETRQDYYHTRRLASFSGLEHLSQVFGKSVIRVWTCIRKGTSQAKCPYDCVLWQSVCFLREFLLICFFPISVCNLCHCGTGEC